MVKLHILGAPGSGKTTLAQDVSSRFHIPHYDLDKVNWEQENALTLPSNPRGSQKVSISFGQSQCCIMLITSCCLRSLGL